MTWPSGRERCGHTDLRCPIQIAAQTWDSPTTWSYMQHRWSNCKACCVISCEAQKKLDWRYTLKDEDPQQPKFEQKARSDDQQYQGRSITCARVREVSRTNNNSSAIRNDGKQKQNPSSLGVILQIQASVDVETVPSAAQVTLVKYGALSYIGPRVWNMDFDKRTRKIDTISKREDASIHCTNKKKIQKKKMTSNMKIRKATLRKKRKPRELRKRNTRRKQHWHRLRPR